MYVVGMGLRLNTYRQFFKSLRQLYIGNNS
jgi:hypothetical protein